MITLQGFAPAWTLPCLSPFVTKTAYYMRLAGIEYAFASVNPFELKTATPFGKVPVINDDGKVVADSTTIIDYLERTRGEPLNKGATLRERAVMLAFNRLLDEHFYWCAVVRGRPSPMAQSGELGELHPGAMRRPSAGPGGEAGIGGGSRGHAGRTRRTWHWTA